MGCPALPGATLVCSVSHPSRTGFFMGDVTKKLLPLAQEHASDLLKRRYPNRYIGRPVLTLDECIRGLVEVGALSKEVIDVSTKKVALLHWMLSRIEVKRNDQAGSDTSFYKSTAWRKLRFSVLSENDGRCCACGSGAKDGVTLHVDHIKPRSKYPELALDPTNMQVLCENCNIGKSDGEAVSF